MRRSRAGLAAAALLLLTAACTLPTGSTGVGVRAVQTNVLYGTYPSPKPAAVAEAPVTPALPAAPEPLPSYTYSSQFASATGGLCPRAPSGAAAEAADVNVDGRPQVGSARWVASGASDINVNGSTVAVPLPPFINFYQRRVANYTDPVPPLPGSPPNDEFNFESILAGLGGVSPPQFTWLVKTDSSLPKDPQGGLTLTRVDGVDPGTGKVLDTVFAPPGPGLLFVPYPIVSGATWQSASADPARGLSLSLSGQVLSRKVIDACGTLVEGWEVTAQMTSNGSTASLDYLVAPQFGGTFTQLGIDGYFFGVTLSKAVLHLGQATPSPLPASFQ